MKVHLHEEQFDGWLHTACGVLDKSREEGENIIVNEERFEAAAKVLRCRNCARKNWPKGGEPE